MKVSQVIEHLKTLDQDQEICALLYTKRLFDFMSDDEMTLTDEAWSKVVTDFASNDFDDVYQFIYDSVFEYAELKTEVK